MYSLRSQWEASNIGVKTIVKTSLELFKTQLELNVFHCFQN